MSGKKILFVCSGLRVGGAEVFLVDLTSQLISKGHQCLIIPLTGGDQIAKRLKQVGCTIIQGKSESFGDLCALFFRLVKKVRQWKPDLIQGWMYHGNFVATLAALFSNAPVVWSVHHSLKDVGEEKWSLRCLLMLSRLISRSPKIIHYCSNVGACQHGSYGFPRDRQVVIPNGFNCHLFSPKPDMRTEARSLIGIGLEGFIIAHIGRFHPMKDHDNFLEAAKLLTQRRSDVNFVLIGENVCDKNTSLVEKRRALGLEQEVSFLGLRADVPELLPGIDLVSTSSAWGESFPIVLGEAMASGIPCVATDVGDCGRLMGASGILVPVRNPVRLAEAWDRLLSESPSVRDDRQTLARNHILENFELGDVAGRFLAQYERVW